MMTTHTPPPSSLGQLLKTTREAKHLSIAHVADTLNLATGLIIKIEANELHHEQATTYLRGYARGYSRYLGIPEATVTQALAQMGLDEKHKPIASQHFTLPQLTSSAHPVRLVTASLIVLLLSLVILWGYLSTPPTPKPLRTPIFTQAQSTHFLLSLLGAHRA